MGASSTTSDDCRLYDACLDANCQSKQSVEVDYAHNAARPSPDSDVAKSLSKVYGGAYEAWLKTYGVKPSWETHSDSLELHIWHGYRPNPSSVSYLLKSLFYPTNETVNIWTHFIPFLLMLYRILAIFKSLQHPTDPVYWPFWINSFGCCYVLLVSTLAHTFNSKSARAQELCMCFDYCAVTTFGLTGLIAVELYICPLKCVTDLGVTSISYIFGLSVVGYASSFFSCLSRHHSCPKRHFLRFGPAIISYIIVCIPLSIKFFTILRGGRLAADHRSQVLCNLGSDNFIGTIVANLTTFVAAGITVFARFPEKYYPGVFDIVGQSHQIFHIFVAFGLYTQNVLAENVMREITSMFEAGRVTASDLSISEWTTIYPLLAFIAVSLNIVYNFAKVLGNAVLQRRKKQL